METQVNLVEPLLERVKEYGKTSIELLKLKTLDKTADVMSALIARILLVFVIVLFAFILNIAVSLWLSDLIGKIYYGFFIVASFYALVGVTVYLFRSSIKLRINNSIINYLTTVLCKKSEL